MTDEEALEKLFKVDETKKVTNTYLCAFDANRMDGETMENTVAGLNTTFVKPDKMWENFLMTKVVVEIDQSDDEASMEQERQTKLLPWLKNEKVAWMEEEQVINVQMDQMFPPWGLDRIDQESRPTDNVYHFDVNGTGVTAFIIDTGIRTSHLEFEGRATCPVSFIRGEACNDDANGHGTYQ